MSFGMSYGETAGDTWADEAFASAFERTGATEMVSLNNTETVVPIKTENDARIGARGTPNGLVEMDNQLVETNYGLGSSTDLYLAGPDDHVPGLGEMDPNPEGLEMTPMGPKRNVLNPKRYTKGKYRDYEGEYTMTDPGEVYPDSEDEMEPSFEESELTESEELSFEESRMEGQQQRGGRGPVQEPEAGVGYQIEESSSSGVEVEPYTEAQPFVPPMQEERPGLAARAWEGLKGLISRDPKYIREYGKEDGDLNQYLLEREQASMRGESFESTEMTDLSGGKYEPPLRPFSEQIERFDKLIVKHDDPTYFDDDVPTNPEHGTELVDMSKSGELEAPDMPSAEHNQLQIADRPSQSELSGAMPDDAMQGLKGLIKGAQDRGMTNRAIAEEFHVGMGSSRAQAALPRPLRPRMWRCG